MDGHPDPITDPFVGDEIVPLPDAEIRPVEADDSVSHGAAVVYRQRKGQRQIALGPADRQLSRRGISVGACRDDAVGNKTRCRKRRRGEPVCARQRRVALAVAGLCGRRVDDRLDACGAKVGGVEQNGRIECLESAGEFFAVLRSRKRDAARRLVDPPRALDRRRWGFPAGAATDRSSLRSAACASRL